MLIFITILTINALESILMLLSSNIIEFYQLLNDFIYHLHQAYLVSPSHRRAKFNHA